MRYCFATFNDDTQSLKLLSQGPGSTAEVGRVGRNSHAPPVELLVLIQRHAPAGHDAQRRDAVAPRRLLTLFTSAARTLDLAEVRHVDVDRL